ncbi:metallophosphoesterase family protein [Aureimonas sp. AU40]|uniref:metallophosphoesterase family protein n=1 Tax=Aureimonas sp. AU40 TaxID=1637747 RepID=UPI0007850294|nr:exonuclease SbcCD subunit D [Aureimonas sp. AU40]
MAFRFVHTADLHLDSPLRSLSLRDPDLAGLIGDASRRALSAIVDLCLEEQVDALVIAGDLYDGEQTSMKTARFLAREMERLHAGGVRVFKIRGNHDAMSRITAELVLPPNVHVFGGRAEIVRIPKGALEVAVHGVSFAKPQAPESLLPKFKPALPDTANIGLLHTSLAGAPGHDVYAPTSVPELQATRFSYWALGHVHGRTAYGDAGGRVVMPGMPQGRDVNEGGPKGVTLVTIRDDRTVEIEERVTSLAEFARVSVDLSGVEDWREAIERIGRALEDARAPARSPVLVARLHLKGRTPLAFRLRRDGDLLHAEASVRAERVGRTFVEKIAVETEPPGNEREAAGPLAELGRLMREDVAKAHGTREAVRALAEKLRDELPSDARDFAGRTEAEFEAFLDKLMVEAGEDMLARLSLGAGEDA